MVICIAVFLSLKYITYTHTHRGYFLWSCCFIVFADPISLPLRCDFSQCSPSHGSPGDLHSNTALTETMQHNDAFSLGVRNNASSWSTRVISNVWMESLCRDWRSTGCAGLWFWPLLVGLIQVCEVRSDSFIFLNTHRVNIHVHSLHSPFLPTLCSNWIQSFTRT